REIGAGVGEEEIDPVIRKRAEKSFARNRCSRSGLLVCDWLDDHGVSLSLLPSYPTSNSLTTGEPAWRPDMMPLIRWKNPTHDLERADPAHPRRAGGHTPTRLHALRRAPDHQRSRRSGRGP